MKKNKILVMTFFILFLFSLSSCSSKTWVSPAPHREIANQTMGNFLKEGEAKEEAYLKTSWGSVKVRLGEEKNELVAVHLEIHNQSKKELVYKREFITFINEKNEAFKDQQDLRNNKIPSEYNDWREIANIHMPVKPERVKYSDLIAKKGMEQETLLNDTLYINKAAFDKSEILKLVFSNEFIPEKEGNVISYQNK